MRYIELQEERLSEVVIGMMRTAEMSVEELNTLIETGLEVGINCLDTADIYARGKSEQVLGDTFAAHPSLRQRVFLQSKCGIRPEEFTWYDFSKEHIIESVEGSLRRLRTDHLDSLLLHRPDVLMQAEEVAEAFRLLHEQGKVRYFGVSNMNPMQISLLQQALPMPLIANQVQLSCAFTPMLDAWFNVNNQNDHALMRDGGILEYCRQQQMLVQAWSVLQYGYFGGVFIDSDKYPKLNEVLQRIAEEQNATKAAVAIAWILHLPQRMQAIAGTTRPARLRDIARATDIRLTNKEWYEIYTTAGNKLP